MSSTTVVLPPGSTPAAESFLQKIWNWIKGKAKIVEADVEAIIGSGAAQQLESIGKTLLDSWAGPLAVAAMQEATDVVTGQMSVSKAVSSLIASAKTSGKSLSEAAALQIIALLQNSLPTAQDPTVTPVT